MRIDFSLDQIFGRDPREVDQLFRSRGLDPAQPYRARVTFNGVTIEQEIAVEKKASRFFIPIPARIY
ncbi:MAG: hypothetical protein P8X63_04625 [Desulfuromonadaceae bacterium]|jgi:hypothetical protein